MCVGRGVRPWLAEHRIVRRPCRTAPARPCSPSPHNRSGTGQHSLVFYSGRLFQGSLYFTAVANTVACRRHVASPDHAFACLTVRAARLEAQLKGLRGASCVRRRAPPKGGGRQGQQGYLCALNGHLFQEKGRGTKKKGAKWSRAARVAAVWPPQQTGHYRVAARWRRWQRARKT